MREREIVCVLAVYETGHEARASMVQILLHTLPRTERASLAHSVLVMTKFTRFGCDDPMTIQLILDYQDLDCPCSIYMGGRSDLTMLKNKNGEADYNLWFHCMASTSSKLVLLGSDTDIWVYEIALMAR